MRVLYVTPTARPMSVITDFLAEEKFACETVAGGEDGFELARETPPYDAILVDLPPREAVAWVRRVRRARIRTPITVLTAHRNIETKIAALNSGADDFLTLPCDLRELVARLHVGIRRNLGRAESVVRTGPLTVNLQRRQAYIAGQPVRISGNEYALLELLSLRKRGAPVNADAYLTHAYSGRGEEPDPKILDVMICKLRKKLREAGAPGLITTEWRRGYRLVDPPRPAAAPSATPVATPLAA